MFSFFKKRKSTSEGAPTDFSFLGADMHSHILPGIDDGAPDVETAVTLVRGLVELGYKKLIASPHVHGDFYRNTPETISTALRDLHEALMLHRVPVEVDAIAEYYLDDYFLEVVLRGGLRTFGERVVLVEVSMAGWPRNFSDLLFEVQAQGYQVLLAHPERYEYEVDLKVFEALRGKGVEMVMNLLAATGYYGKGVQAAAARLMDAGMYTYLGTDLHNDRHLANLRRMAVERPETMERMAAYGFKNSTLLNGPPAAGHTGGPAELA